MGRPSSAAAGQQFGSWTLVRFSDRKKNQIAWIARCQCGIERRVWLGTLRSGGSISCGCVGRRVAAQKKTKHGYGHAPEYKIWRCMIQRCENPNWDSYPYYGGRGIKVYGPWHDIREWMAYMGPRPTPKHQQDRIDGSKDYEPGNVRWVTKKEQARNQKNNHLLTYNGTTRTIAEWTEVLNLPVGIIRKRINNLKWSVEKALTTPPVVSNRSKKQTSQPPG